MCGGYGNYDDDVYDDDIDDDDYVVTDDAQELAEVVSSGVNDIERILSELHDKHPAFVR